MCRIEKMSNILHRARETIVFNENDETPVDYMIKRSNLRGVLSRRCKKKRHIDSLPLCVPFYPFCFPFSTLLIHSPLPLSLSSPLSLATIKRASTFTRLLRYLVAARSPRKRKLLRGPFLNVFECRKRTPRYPGAAVLANDGC